MQNAGKGIFTLILSLCTGMLFADTKPELPPDSVVVSAASDATKAGIQILQEGGNAFDAAVAVVAALAVVEPYNSGLGGGGFWLFHVGKTGEDVFIDSRERAPLNIKPDMFLDAHSQIIPQKTLDGALAAAIPGEVAGMDYVSSHYGHLSLAQDFAPAISLAIKGFPVTPRYQRYAESRLSALQASPAAAAVFLQSGKVPKLGDVIQQKDLANTLEAIAQQGKTAFYEGARAKQLVDGVDKGGGVWQLQDLSSYHVRVEKPLYGTYHGIQIITAPLPSAGGIALITMLNIVEKVNLDSLNTEDKIHYIVEAMRRAYADRALYLGDEDFVKTPVTVLISKKHGSQLAKSIDPVKATPSNKLSTEAIRLENFSNTTHISIIDKEGNWASVTVSLNNRFGSGFMPAGTGVLLNDHMDDFSIKPGEKNLFGLMGNDKNRVEPGKTPLSSMAPTFLVTKDRVGILGTSGGSRIPTMVLLAVLDFDHHSYPQSWVSLLRFHQQYLPDVVYYEPGAFSESVMKGLQRRGYTLEAAEAPYGNMQGILWDRGIGRLYGASDPRGDGAAQMLPNSTKYSQNMTITAYQD